ncbi:hypothetical protein [Streptomyces mexicanus]|uniref:hypothetical protein n=1 Tax=Streptomyces mexicanus TaxID=178566 RepID=UPI0036AE9374
MIGSPSGRAASGALPPSDSVGIRQHTLWLSRDELTEMTGEMRKVITARITRGSSPERNRHPLSPILFPTETQLPRND